MKKQRIHLPAALALLLSAGAAAAQPVCEPPTAQVIRGSFATAIEEREPSPRPAALRAGEGQAFYFTEISGAAGGEIIHRWRLNGEALAETRLKVGSARWRTWSSVQGRDLRRGQLSLQVEDGRGCLLHADHILVEDPAVSAGQATPAIAQAADAAAPVIETQAFRGPSEEERNAQRAARLYRQAQGLKEQDRYTAAMKKIDEALALLPQDSRERQEMMDERHYHLPLAKARWHLRQKDAKALRATLAPVRGYLRDHPKRYEYTPMLDNYYKALYLLERKR